MTTLIAVSAHVPDIPDIWKYYQDSMDSLRFKKYLILSFLRGDVDVAILANHGITLDPLTSSTEVTSLFNDTVRELENLVKFNLLSAAEGHIRYDFAVRINNNRTDSLSASFATLFASIGSQAKRVRFQGNQGILAEWNQHLAGHWKGALLQNFVDVLELRHWLAHGRWWQLEPTVNLPVSEIKEIVENALDAMSLP